MNHLAVVGENEWELPNHAHVVVHDEDGRALLTIYDCGAAQKPPTAQVTGRLVRVDAEYEHVPQPTGYIAKLREPSILERQGENHWVIRSRR